MLSSLLATVSEETKYRFETLYFYYRDLMMHISLKILNSKELAEEAMQESLIKILINIEDIGEIKCHKTKSWVVIITKRTAINKLEYEKRREHDNDNILEYISFETKNLEDKVLQNITIDEVKKGLKELGGEYFEILILKYYYGYPDCKLSKHFGISPAGIRKKCERGKKRLLRNLNQVKEVNLK